MAVGTPRTSSVSGFPTRYSPGAREGVKRVQDGEIGDIVAIEGGYNTGPLWHRGRQPEWSSRTAIVDFAALPRSVCAVGCRLSVVTSARMPTRPFRATASSSAGPYREGRRGRFL